MLVCHCRRVTDREIVSLVREGVDDADAIGDFCGAATKCGGCRPEVERLVTIATRQRAERAEQRAVERDIPSYSR